MSKAAEILSERWTLIIVREMICGNDRFNEIERRLPGIPKSVLSKRLKDLEVAGIVVKRQVPGNRRFSYNLTMAGEDLFGIIERMGVWAQRWVIQDIGPEDTDPDMLMWDMQRRINMDKLPPRRIVVQFELLGAQRKIYWLVLEKPQPSICLEDPGFEIDLVVTANSLALHRVWMGRLDMADALRKDQIKLEGPVDLKRAFPGWLALNLFAGVPYEGVATTA